MLRFMVGDACLFSTRPALLSPRSLMKTLLVSLAAGLSLVALSGCDDESPSGSEPADPVKVLKREHVLDIAATLKQAIGAFEHRNYDACAALCAYVLSREPAYEPALWLSITANSAKAGTEENRANCEVYVWWMFQPTEGQLIPDEDKLTYPHLGLPKPAETVREIPSAPASISANRME